MPAVTKKLNCGLRVEIFRREGKTRFNVLVDGYYRIINASKEYVLDNVNEYVFLRSLEELKHHIDALEFHFNGSNDGFNVRVEDGYLS